MHGGVFFFSFLVIGFERDSSFLVGLWSLQVEYEIQTGLVVVSVLLRSSRRTVLGIKIKIFSCIILTLELFEILLTKYNECIAEGISYVNSYQTTIEQS